MSVISKKITERWQQAGNQNLYYQVIACLQSDGVLSRIPNLNQYEGRWDLRGLNLANLGQTRIPIHLQMPDGLKLDFVYGKRLRFSNVAWQDIDFSYANLDSAIIENCILKNVLFNDVVGQGINDRGSTFQDCSFFKADWRGATLGLDGARYESVKFQRSDLRNIHCYRGYFVDCDFSDAKLENIDFKVSHFSNCKFKGKLKKIWFRGYYSLKSEEKRYGVTERNLMQNVNFAEAQFWDVMFTQKIDLSTVTPPQDGKHVMFPRWQYTLEASRQEVEEQWNGSMKEEASRYLDTVFTGHDRTMNIVNLLFLEDILSGAFSDIQLQQEFVLAFTNLLLNHV